MNNNTLFTIAIPAYKSKFLGEAIKSCLSQTYSNFELLIVDDASPEVLKSVVDRFHDDRIRFYRNEKNCGAVDVVDNWNICLSYAKGDYDYMHKLVFAGSKYSFFLVVVLCLPII